MEQGYHILMNREDKACIASGCTRPHRFE